MPALAALLALLAHAGVWLGGCCDPFRAESPHYGVHAGPGPLGYDTVGSLEWNGTTRGSIGAPWGYYVIVSVDREPSAEMIELYDSAGRVDLVGTYRRDISNINACQNTGLVYDLSALPAGTYTLVHRASTAPPGARALGPSWTTYEGERALVTTLVVTTETRDGGP